MFDGGGAGCILLLIMPVIAIFIGVLVRTIGPVIERTVFKREKKDEVSSLIAWLLVPITCIGGTLIWGFIDSLPHPWIKPISSDIVGAWHVSSDTVAILQEDYRFPVSAHALVFKDDGTFYMENVPNFWRQLKPLPEGNAKYLSGSGTWRIEAQPVYPVSWKLVIRFQTINIIQDETSLYFIGELAPYALAGVSEPNHLRFRFQKENVGIPTWWMVLLGILAGLATLIGVAILRGIQHRERQVDTLSQNVKSGTAQQGVQPKCSAA